MTVHVHSGQHQNGGIDEINVVGLSGVLADKQDADKLQGVGVSPIAPTDAQVLIYDGTDEQWEPTDHPDPSAHKTSHQNDGTDEISVAGLSGELADAQPSTWAKVTGKPSTFDPAAHKTSHQNDGTDEIDVGGLSGDLADAQDAKAHLLGSATHTADTLANLNAKVSDATLDDSGASRTPSAHKTSHAGGGADKLKYTRQILFFDPTDPIATGTDDIATVVYRGPTLALVRWDMRVKTAPTGAAMIFDVNVAGTSIWNTTQANRPTIADAGSAGTGTSFDTTTLSDGDVLTLDYDQVGSGVAGGQVTLTIEGECNLEAD